MGDCTLSSGTGQSGLYAATCPFAALVVSMQDATFMEGCAASQLRANCSGRSSLALAVEYIVRRRGRGELAHGCPPPALALSCLALTSDLSKLHHGQ